MQFICFEGYFIINCGNTLWDPSKFYFVWKKYVGGFYRSNYYHQRDFHDFLIKLNLFVIDLTSGSFIFSNENKCFNIFKKHYLSHLSSPSKTLVIHDKNICCLRYIFYFFFGCWKKSNLYNWHEVFCVILQILTRNFFFIMTKRSNK